MIKSSLATHWSNIFQPCSRLIVGFSGGLDSTVLLHWLASIPELRNKLFAIHVNHGISPNAKMWEQHAITFCEKLGIACKSITIAVDISANIEERARMARFNVFNDELQPKDALVLGHHLDDQAETVLMQLFRGAGVNGLAAMSEVSEWNEHLVCRPLLTTSRTELELYAQTHQLTWVEDESNQDSKYTRNFIRNDVFPLLQNKWPRLNEQLAKTAQHCQQALSNLETLAQIDCPDLGSTKLPLISLIHLEPERIANVLQVWLRKNKQPLPPSETFNRIISELVFARNDAKSLVAWNDIEIRRYHSYLYLLPKQIQAPKGPIAWTDFPNPMVSLGIQAKSADKGLKIPSDAKIEIRFREGGETFVWHGQTKSLKKLFQEWEILPWERDSVPLLYVDGILAAVVGYAISDLFYSVGKEAVWVE